MEGYFAGLISGTSTDGIDAAVLHFDADRPNAIVGLTHPYPPDMRAQLQQIDDQLGAVALARLDVKVGRIFAEAVLAVCEAAGLKTEQLTAVGSHGQTVWHDPNGQPPITLQIGDANTIAERTGAPVVADFRRRDLAAGGEGAPLAPAFHQGLLGSERPCTLVNLGGIANISVLRKTGEPPLGYDSGPANTLMDAWCQRHLGEPYDEGGKWAASGVVRPHLLERLLADPFFQATPPKSTGPERFNLRWLDAHISDERPVDIQATLLELTARSVTNAITTSATDSGAARRVLLCGGGVANRLLVARLTALLPHTTVTDTASVGIDPHHVEALGFAWLARQTLMGRPGNIPEVTGAYRAVVLGGIYPATRPTGYSVCP